MKELLETISVQILDGTQETEVVDNSFLSKKLHESHSFHSCPARMFVEKSSEDIPGKLSEDLQKNGKNSDEFFWGIRERNSENLTRTSVSIVEVIPQQILTRILEVISGEIIEGFFIGTFERNLSGISERLKVRKNIEIQSKNSSEQFI